MIKCRKKLAVEYLSTPLANTILHDVSYLQKVCAINLRILNGNSSSKELKMNIHFVLFITTLQPTFCHQEMVYASRAWRDCLVL